MKVYVSKDGKVYGPYSVVQVRQYLEAGNFALTDHACRDGVNWVPIAEMPAIATSVKKQIEKPTKKPRRRFCENQILQTILYYLPLLFWTTMLLDRELVMFLMLETHLLSLFPPLVSLFLFLVFCQCGFILVTVLGTTLLRLLGFKSHRKSVANWILLAVFSSLLVRACFVFL